MRLVLSLLLVLASGCSTPRDTAGPAPSPDLPCLTCEGRVLSYTVGAGQQQYPFVATITQNDADGLAFDFDLGNGNQTGSVTMTPEARASAMGFQNQFGSRAYTLTDRTTVFLSREAFRLMKEGGPVNIDFGGNDGTDKMQLADCTEGGFTVSVVGETETYPVCVIDGQSGNRLVVLDDDANPLILAMTTGSFEVALDGAE